MKILALVTAEVLFVCFKESLLLLRFIDQMEVQETDRRKISSKYNIHTEDLSLLEAFPGAESSL